MSQTVIQIAEMTRIMELLFHVLDIRITFFDPEENEIPLGAIKPPCLFCRTRRLDSAFDARCVECDRSHLALAKEKNEICIYRCHAGLLEGIVPLSDKRHRYLGAIVFGQLADEANPIPGIPVSNAGKMKEIGDLLLYLTGYIRENEVIRQAAAPWQKRVQHLIRTRLSEKISLSEMARASGCSPSYFSHNFRRCFGTTFRQEVRKERVEAAKKLLLDGLSVAECADRTGYCDPFSFSKDFKKITGLSPSCWKKQNR